MISSKYCTEDIIMSQLGIDLTRQVPTSFERQLYTRNLKFISTDSSYRFLHKFLYSSLIEIKDNNWTFPENIEIDSLLPLFINCFNNDRINVNESFIDFTKRYFSCVNTKVLTTDDKILSPLYGLVNTNFNEQSEMNFQEALSIIFSY